MRRCIREDEVHVLHACQNKPLRGNYAIRRTTYKVLKTRYYWPTLFKHANKCVSRCDDCQRMGKPNKRDEIPLNPQVTWEPFENGVYILLGQ